MEVSTSLRCLAGSGGCPAEESVKYITEAAKVKSFEALPEYPLATGVSESIIGIALFRVREYFVGLVYLFKLCFGPIILIMVGVILKGQLTESLFNFFVGSISVDTEHFIIIAFRCHINGTLSPLSPSP